MANNHLVTDPTVPPPTPQQRRRAVRTAAHHASDSAELARLLEMLGLSPEEGLPRDPDRDYSTAG
jgi:hypothetical protein